VELLRPAPFLQVGHGADSCAVQLSQGNNVGCALPHTCLAAYPLRLYLDRSGIAVVTFTVK